MKISPLPSNFGVGFSSMSPNSEWEKMGYEYNPVGMFHNYNFTVQNYQWPGKYESIKPVVLDGFSPNLNKHLHAGHLKNLAVATAIAKITKASPVAMLGASQGINDGAIEAYQEWCKLAQYSPLVYLDTLLSPVHGLEDGTGEFAGCKMYNGVVIYKSDGKPTYSAHDLSFANEAKPTHYLVGAEQKQHFASLGLGDKHLPLGLVLDAKGQKMKSKTKNKETGEQVVNPDAVSAQELFDEVQSVLKETPDPKKLAWNILTWQFNSSSVSSNTKYNLEQWAKPESPGLYITYTYAKMMSALALAHIRHQNSQGNEKEISETDVEIVGVANYFDYYLAKSQAAMEPCHVAQFAMTLAKKLANAYGKQKIAGGPNGFIFAIHYATAKLKTCMELLSMYPLTSV